MTIKHPGLSRRTLLSTVTLGVPALGLLGAANLIGDPAASAKKTRITVAGMNSALNSAEPSHSIFS